MKNLIANRSLLLLLLMAGTAGCGTTGVDPQTPTLSYTTTGSGCANIFLFVENARRTEALVVRIDRDSLQLSTTPRSFDIAEHPDALDLHIDLFYQPRDYNQYCSDVGISGPNNLQARWQAVRGTAEISVSDTSVAFNMAYRASVRLSDVVFVDPTGARSVTLHSLAIDSVVVGWLPG